MQAKEYLLQLKRLNILIQNKKQLLEDLTNKSLCRSPQYQTETKPTQCNPNSQQNVMLSLIDLEQELNNDINYYLKKKKEIIKSIDRLDSSNEIDLLYKKYVMFETWDQISSEMNYTFRWVLKLHASALKNMDKILKSSY